MSSPAFVAVRDLIGRATASGRARLAVREATGTGGLHCELRRAAGARTVLECTEGRLVLHDIELSLRRHSVPDGPVTTP